MRSLDGWIFSKPKAVACYCLIGVIHWIRVIRRFHVCTIYWKINMSIGSMYIDCGIEVCLHYLLRISSCPWFNRYLFRFQLMLSSKFLKLLVMSLELVSRPALVLRTWIRLDGLHPGLALACIFFKIWSYCKHLLSLIEIQDVLHCFVFSHL